jgi:hypothetical protein
MVNEIKKGDRVKDVCGDIGEVVDIEYDENGELWRYILLGYSDDGRDTWPAHPVYTYKVD